MLDNMALGCACVRYWVNGVQVVYIPVIQVMKGTSDQSVSQWEVLSLEFHSMELLVCQVTEWTSSKVCFRCLVV